MAKTKTEVVQEVVVADAPMESVYAATELIDNHKAFNTSKEIVTVALRLAGKTTASFSEAKTIIDKFKNKEVK